MSLRNCFGIIIKLQIILPLIILAVCYEYAGACIYDNNLPSLIHARMSFKSLNYVCAEKEIKDFIILNESNLEDKANGHILLAAVYYAMLRDNQGRREKVIEQFKQAFRYFKEWQGELDIRSPEFKQMMEEAKKEVELEPETPIIETVTKPNCPSAKSAWIGTSVFAGSSILYLISAGQANNRWAEHENNPLEIPVYDSYVRVSHFRNLTGVISLGAGIFTAYQWWEYFRAKKNCGNHPKKMFAEKGLRINVNTNQIYLTYIF